jgi:Serine/Threonine/Tyrosine Kinase found in polyvalent proteins
MAKANKGAIDTAPIPAPDSTVEQEMQQIEEQPVPGAPAPSAVSQLSPDTVKAFQDASAQKVGQLQTPGDISLNPFDWGKRFAPSFWEHALQSTGEMAAGLEHGLANFFDPKALYSKQTDGQLQDGIKQSQEKLDQLQQELDDNPNEYTYNKNSWQIANLQNDIVAMQKQLGDRKGVARVPDVWEQTGQALRSDAATTEQYLKTVQEKHPLNQVFEAGAAGRVAQLAGGVAPYLALGEVGAPLEMALGAGQGYEQTWQEAEHMGVDPTVANKAASWSAAFMPLQIATFRTVLAPFMQGMVGRTVRELATTAAKNAALGAGVGGAQTIYNNVIASTSGLDPNRKITDGLAQSIGEQAGMMTALGLVTQAPSFALRAGSKARIVVDKTGGEPAPTQEQAPPAQEAPLQPSPLGVRHPDAGPGEVILTTDAQGNLIPNRIIVPQGEAAPPVTAETESALDTQLEALGKEEEPLMQRRDVGQAAAAGGEGEVPVEPIPKRTIRQNLSDLVDRVGQRANFLLADPGELPLRYRAALQEQGLNPNTYRAFFDQDSNDWVVNPNSFKSEADLNESIIRNFIPNTFADKAKITPLDSWQDAAGNAMVARLIGRDPNADSTTDALYDGRGNVFLNVPKLMRNADTIHDAMGTTVHEIGVHQGLRTLFGSDYHDFNTFLDRVWNGMEQSGMGDHIASMYDTNVEGLAKSYDLGTTDENGDFVLSQGEKRRVAEELLARYAERYDPQELDKAPNVLQKAIRLVRDGMRRYQGLEFDDTDAYNFIKDAWRASEPPRDPDAEASLLAKRIARKYVPPESESERARELTTRQFGDAAVNVSPGGDGVPAQHGALVTASEIAESSRRVGEYARANGLELPAGFLSKYAEKQLGGGDTSSEHTVYKAKKGDYVIKVTKGGGDYFGPYGMGLAPAEESNGPFNYLAGPATADTYLERHRLNNELFGTQYHLEGFVKDPQTGLYSVVTTQPLLRNVRTSHPDEIAPYMAARGFHPVTDRDYYNPQSKILVMDAHGGNVLRNKTTGQMHVVDVVPMHLDGKPAAEYEAMALDPSHMDYLSKEADQKVKDALQRQMAALGVDVDFNKLPAKPDEEAQIAHIQNQQQDEIDQLRAKRKTGALSLEEQDRLDELEFGPMLKKDIDTELGPDSNPKKPPNEILERALESMARADPATQYVRQHALRTVMDEKDTEQARLFNASMDQLIAEHGGREFWKAVTDQWYSDFNNDIEGLGRALMQNAFNALNGGGEISAALYTRVKNDLIERSNTQRAAGNEAAATSTDSFRNSLESWANAKRTEWGKEGAAWADAYFSTEGLVSNMRSKFLDAIQDRINKNPKFRESVSLVRQAGRDATEAALRDPTVARILNSAQRAHNIRALSAKSWQQLMAEELVNQAAGADAPPRVKDAIQVLMGRLKQTITAQMKDAGIKMTPDTLAKVRASKTIKDAVEAWPYFQHVADLVRAEGMKEFAHTPAMAERFKNLDIFTSVPFSDTQLAKFAGEQGVKIQDLFKQHRNQIGQTIQSLSDFLTRNSYLNKAQAELIEKHVSDFITNAVRGRVQGEFQKIIEAANDGKPVRAGQGSTMKRLLELVNMGAFGDRDVAEALAPVYGYKTFTPQMEAQLREQADFLDRLRREGRDGFQTEAAKAQLLRTIGNYSQLKRLPYFMNILQGNLIANIPTHTIAFINEILTGSVDVAHHVGELAARSPGDIPLVLSRVMRAWIGGFGDALPEFGYIMKTGYDPARFRSMEDLRGDKARTTTGPGFFETNPTRRLLENSKWLQRLGVSDAFAKIGGMAVDPAYKYTYRGVGALHNLIYGSFGKASEYMLAVRAGHDMGLTMPEAIDRASNMIYGTDAVRAEAEQRVRSEGLTGLEAKMRLNELIDQKVDQGYRDQGDMWGTRANAMQEPPGVIGAISNGLARLAGQEPFLRQWMPFTRIPGNLLNTAIEMSPLGFVRLMSPDMVEQYLTRRGQIKLTAEQFDDLKANLLTKAVMGTAAMAGLAALAQIRGANGQPLIQVHGAGPVNQDHKYQLMDSGWQPYTIEVNGHYYPFEYLPCWFGLACVGNYYDAYRYPNKKGDPDPDPAQALQYMLSHAGSTLVDRSFLRGVSDLLDTIHQTEGRNDAPDIVEKYIASQVKNMIPIAGMSGLKQTYQQFIDNTLYRARGFAGVARDIPFMAHPAGLKPVIDALGERVQMHPYEHRFQSDAANDPVWDFLDKNHIWISKPSREKLNGQQMDEDQTYDYTVLRGQHLRTLLSGQLARLDKIEDQDKLDEAVKHIEQLAKKQAKGDMLRGVKPVVQ